MLDDAMCVEDTHNLSKGCFPKTPVDADIKNDMSMRTESDSARDAGAPGPTIGLWVWLRWPTVQLRRRGQNELLFRALRVTTQLRV